MKRNRKILDDLRTKEQIQRQIDDELRYQRALKAQRAVQDGRPFVGNDDDPLLAALKSGKR